MAPSQDTRLPALPVKIASQREIRASYPDKAEHKNIPAY
jgi:hypothetical protein